VEWEQNVCEWSILPSSSSASDRGTSSGRCNVTSSLLYSLVTQNTMS